MPGADPEQVRGIPRSLHLENQIKLDKKYNFDVRDAHKLLLHFD